MPKHVSKDKNRALEGDALRRTDGSLNVRALYSQSDIQRKGRLARIREKASREYGLRRFLSFACGQQTAVSNVEKGDS